MRVQLGIGRGPFRLTWHPQAFSQGRQARLVQAVGRTRGDPDQLGDLIEGQAAPEVGHDDLALLERQRGQRGLRRLGVNQCRALEPRGRSRTRREPSPRPRPRAAASAGWRSRR